MARRGVIRRGAGDRWLAGEPVPGVSFAHHEPVEITSGRYAGHAGRVLLLLALAPETLYLVRLGADAGEVRVRQSALRAARPS